MRRGRPRGSAPARRAARRASGARRRSARSGRRPAGARAPAAARRARASELGERRAATPRRSAGAAGAGSGRSARPGSAAAPRSLGEAAGSPQPLPIPRLVGRQDRRQASAHAAAARLLSHGRPPPCASSKYASEPAQCGSWWITGWPKLGASPIRTLRGMTVSKTSCGKCSRTSRSTSCASRVRPSCIVSSMPGDRQPRVQLALDQRQRVEQAGESLEREVLGLDRDDHAIGRDQRVDGQRAERGRAVEEREGEAVADRRRARRAAGARSPRAAAARRSRRRGRGWQATSDRCSIAVGRIASSSVALAGEHVVDARVARPSAARARRWRWPAGPCRRAASRSPPRRCRPRGSRPSSSCRRRPSGWRSRRRCSSAGGLRRSIHRPHGSDEHGQRLGRFFAPSGRFRAIPGRRGKRSGVGATLRRTCRWRCSAPGYG